MQIHLEDVPQITAPVHSPSPIYDFKVQYSAYMCSSYVSDIGGVVKFI